MTNLAANKTSDNPLAEELFVKLVLDLPTLRINLAEDSALLVSSVPDCNETMTPIDTSAILFLFVIESRHALPMGVVKKFIEAVAKMSTYHYNPKYLVVSFVLESSDSMSRKCCFALGPRKILDFTVIQLTQPEAPNWIFGTNRSVPLQIVHQLNPFKKQSTRVISYSTIQLLSE